METVRRNRITVILRRVCPFLAFFVSGCMLWTPQWQQPDSWMPASDVSWLTAQAEAKTHAIVDRTSLIEAVEAYETILTDNPAHFETLTTLAELYVLLGAAYCDDATEKKTHYRRAMRYSEQALYTQSEFRRRVLQGDPTWLACEAVNPDGMPALSTWNLAVLMLYRDCLGPAGRLINYRWMPRVRRVLERMTRIDPAWGQGFLEVQWGLYYLSAPEILAGDRVKSHRHFNRAVARDPDQSLNRWFRARYRHRSEGDKQAFLADMRTVAGRPADTHHGSGPWMAYCRRNAAESLARIDDYF